MDVTTSSMIVKSAHRHLRLGPRDANDTPVPSSATVFEKKSMYCCCLSYFSVGKSVSPDGPGLGGTHVARVEEKYGTPWLVKKKLRVTVASRLLPAQGHLICEGGNAGSRRIGTSKTHGVRGADESP